MRRPRATSRRPPAARRQWKSPVRAGKAGPSGRSGVCSLHNMSSRSITQAGRPGEPLMRRIWSASLARRPRRAGVRPHGPPAPRRGRGNRRRPPRSGSARCTSAARAARAVAAAKTTSPSMAAWTGRSARARPSCAMIATRFACALVRSASVATMAILVFCGAAPFSFSASAPSGRAGRPAEAAEFAVALVGRGPEMRACRRWSPARPH